MADYRLYPRADAAQDRIWRYTLEMWGEAQALAYIEGLHAHFRKLTTLPQIWRPLPSKFKQQEPVKAVYFSRYSQHYIFFKILDNGDLGIMSILHGRTDMPARLRSDLAILERQNGES